jgi:hypothetical protein
MRVRNMFNLRAMMTLTLQRPLVLEDLPEVERLVD